MTEKGVENSKGRRDKRSPCVCVRVGRMRGPTLDGKEGQMKYAEKVNVRQREKEDAMQTRQEDEKQNRGQGVKTIMQSPMLDPFMSSQ